MKTLHFILFLILALPLSIAHSTKETIRIPDNYHRRILHQPLYPVTSAPPPESEPPPPPPDSPVLPGPDQPFFPEDQIPPPPPPPPLAPANGTLPIPKATQPSKHTKTVAIAISVVIVTLGMLSAFTFFLYCHRGKQLPGGSQKMVGGNSQKFPEESRMPPSSFLYIGAVEPSRHSVNEENEANGSPYHKLNSVKVPSPELQPLPPLTKPLRPPQAMSKSDEESPETAFYMPQGSSISTDDGDYTPVLHQSDLKNCSPGGTLARTDAQATNYVPHSKRTSPKSRLSASSLEMKHLMIPSVKQPPLPPPPPPPPPPQLNKIRDRQQAVSYRQSLKFSSPPPPPNMAVLQSINNPPLPSPPLGLSTTSKIRPVETSVCQMSSRVSRKPQSESPNSKPASSTENTDTVNEFNKSATSSERLDGDDMDGAKPKLKALHWDKVRATSDRATVWDQLKSSSFQLNEDMMESLFICNSTNSVPMEATRKSVLPPVEQENRVLDTKKSQNIAIMLRALNATRDEVSEALLDGNPEGLGAELLETLVKMAPTKEEEIKLREYSGDISNLGSAERFLKAVLDIPFAFNRVEAMLYIANFDAEVKYLRKSFQTLEVASEELKNSRLFLKLLEAVLRTGNRMNVGTNRGDAISFKLDTLLKLVDIKGTDGKTTLLHFVVQEIIRYEGTGTEATSVNIQNKTHLKMEDDFKKQGLQVVAGLSRDLSNVKKSAGMDSDVLSSYVTKLEMGLEKVRLVLQYEKPDMQGKFFNSMKLFLKEAEDEITRIKADERKTLALVKEVTEYFHGDAAKEEAHPFRIFLIVRDFLSILDHVCKEVGKMQDRTMVGSARSFRISATASLPVLNRYNVRQDRSLDEESSSP